jgi:hypothetical protein
VSRHLVLARVIEPTSKPDGLRAAACAARTGLGPASLMFYDASALHFDALA